MNCATAVAEKIALSRRAGQAPHSGGRRGVGDTDNLAWPAGSRPPGSSRAPWRGNVAVLHRLSDLGAAGAAEVEKVRAGTGPASDRRPEWSTGPAAGGGRSDATVGDKHRSDLLPQARRGVALGRWARCPGAHISPPTERPLVDTDATIGGPPMRNPAARRPKRRGPQLVPRHPGRAASESMPSPSTAPSWTWPQSPRSQGVWCAGEGPAGWPRLWPPTRRAARRRSWRVVDTRTAWAGWQLPYRGLEAGE